MGAGAAPPAIAAYGGPQYTPGQATKAFEEAMLVMKAMSDPAQRSVRFDGEYHHLQGAHPGPFPAEPVPIMVGSYGPRMLRITGRLGDGWLPTNSYAPPEPVPGMQRVIDEAATEAGRDPKAIQRIYNVMGTITNAGAPVSEGQNLVGPPHFWVDTLLRYREELGFDSFLFWPLNADSEAQAALFVEHVAPSAGQELPAPPPGTWHIDPLHSSIGFVARHLGFVRVRGRFTDASGVIRITEPVQKSTAEVRIATATIDTGVPARDRHLRSVEFLDSERHPFVEFRGARVRHESDSWLMDGELTIAGITRPVTLTGDFLGEDV
ncbi:LLM class flavin-dependent oxidoreductase [Streptomyces sp. NPDC000880]